MSIVKLTPATNGGSVQLKAPNDTSGTDVVLTLPNSDGNADQYLKTDGSGALSWGTVSTAEQDASTGDYTLTSGDLKFATDVKGIRFNGNSSTGYIISDTTSSNAIITNVGGNLNSWSWRFGGTEKFTFTSTGNIAFASGNGIDFGATANAPENSPTTNSELFDDYEEGTWTPVLAGVSSAGTGTYADTWGSYTRIGRVVFASFRLYQSAHTGSGGMRLDGLPFTAVTSSGTATSTSNGNHTVGSIDGESLSLTKNKISAQLENANTRFRIMQSDGDMAWVNIENGQLWLNGTIWYETN